MARKTTKPAPPKTDLPPDVKTSDLSYPKHPRWIPEAEQTAEDKAAYDAYYAFSRRLQQEGDIGTGMLTFYQTKGFGWVLATLQISSGRKHNTTDRTYGVTLDGKQVRVGHGPHVTQTVTVYLSQDNLERLQKYVDLWRTGLEDANMTRDHISSRRAQGQINRANGLSSWRW